MPSSRRTPQRDSQGLLKELQPRIRRLAGDAAEGNDVGLSVAAEAVAAMDAARADADRLETLTDKSYWPYPTYSDLLFYV